MVWWPKPGNSVLALTLTGQKVVAGDHRPVGAVGSRDLKFSLFHPRLVWFGGWVSWTRILHQWEFSNCSRSLLEIYWSFVGSLGVWTPFTCLLPMVCGFHFWKKVKVIKNKQKIMGFNYFFPLPLFIYLSIYLLFLRKVPSNTQLKSAKPPQNKPQCVTNGQDG